MNLLIHLEKEEHLLVYFNKPPETINHSLLQNLGEQLEKKRLLIKFSDMSGRPRRFSLSIVAVLEHVGALSHVALFIFIFLKVHGQNCFLSTTTF